MAYIYPITKENTLSYRVYYPYKKKNIYLGIYPDKEKAQKAFDYVHALLANSLGTEAYDSKLISFSKFISLINFRDYGVYFNSPIYIQKGFFYYYLAPDLRLLFDIQDLFFCSTNKIYKRGNYIYTGNSVSQTSILNRFGISSSSTYNVDYFFVNANRYDFRRQNLSILNHFTGVSYTLKYGKPVYVARITLERNSLVIGHYDSELHAAIAYNKAAHILMAQNTHKEYKLNQIDYLTSTEYKAIYDSVDVSPRLSLNAKQKRVVSSKHYRGVCKDKGSFRANIGYANKQIYLGSYPTEKRAAQAYNFASFYLYGTQGYINDVSPLIFQSDEAYIAEKIKKAHGLKK